MIDPVKKAELKSFVRIKELYRNPIPGSFDIDHLKAIHAYIFQDSPQHNPGQFRKDTITWVKNRKLEAEDLSYSVPYCRGKLIQKNLLQTLSAINLHKITKFSPIEFCQYLTSLYGDLDYIHPFYEGNSRTLRIFTKQLALSVEHVLDWNTSDASAAIRDLLYKARDIEVYKRAYPGISKEKIANLPDKLEFRSEFEAYEFGFKLIENSTSLEEFIKNSIHKEKLKFNMNHAY